MAQGTGQGAGHGRLGQGAPPPRRRRNGQPAAAYTWHVAPGGVLVVVDLNRCGWRSVTNDAEGAARSGGQGWPEATAACGGAQRS